MTIYRDPYDVPHVYGKTRAATEFGAGWATAEDRGLDLQLLRGPARIAALDVPGYDAFSVALSARTFVPSAATEAFLAQQTALAEKTAAGRQLIKDVDAYLLGINAYFKKAGGFVTPFTRNDITAIGTLIGAVFGAGGGNEGRSAQFLSALQQRLGDTKGLASGTICAKPRTRKRRSRSRHRSRTRAGLMGSARGTCASMPVATSLS